MKKPNNNEEKYMTTTTSKEENSTTTSTSKAKALSTVMKEKPKRFMDNTTTFKTNQDVHIFRRHSEDGYIKEHPTRELTLERNSIKLKTTALGIHIDWRLT